MTIWYIRFPIREKRGAGLSREGCVRAGSSPASVEVAPDLLAPSRVKTWLLEYHLKRLPTPESIRDSWVFAVFGPSLLRLDYWIPSRNSLALGIGLGWFIGLLPVFGFHLALGLLIGSLVRCHLPAIVFGTFLSNPFTIPGILALQYVSGRWLCSLAGYAIPPGISGLSSAPHLLIPVLVGGVASALAAGMLGYAGVWIYLGRRGRKIPGWVG